MGFLHLIRHGTTEGNKARKYYGSTDLPLANDGVDAIIELAAAGSYPTTEGAVLYTTGLLRTEQTFFLIYGDQEHQQIAELREYDFGDFEMKSHEELVEHPDYQAWISDERGLRACPNGESPVAFRERVVLGLTRILEQYHKPQAHDLETVIVCHGGVISVVMGTLFPESDKNIYQWQPDPGRGYSVLIQDGKAASYEAI